MRFDGWENFFCADADNATVGLVRAPVEECRNQLAGFKHRDVYLSVYGTLSSKRAVRQAIGDLVFGSASQLIELGTQEAAERSSDGSLAVYILDVRDKFGALIRNARTKSLDSLHKKLLTGWKMSTMERRIAEPFEAASLREVATLALAHEWADALSAGQLERLQLVLDDAKQLQAQARAGVSKQSGKDAFVADVNARIDECAGRRLRTQEKLDLVSLIHEAQELGATLYFQGVPCSISTRRRSDASTYVVRLQEIGANKQLRDNATIPENLVLK
ncbi:MAG: hypothetical protein R3C53_19170 [Pirellulaceae bacterium]